MTNLAARRWAFGGATALLVGLTWAAFSPSLENGFVNADDRRNFVDNFAYRGLGWDQVVYAFTQPRLGVYQPIGSLLLSVQYALFGMDPRGYHLTSLLIHALNAVLLLGVVEAIARRAFPTTGRTISATIGCVAAVGLFATHPLRVEPVSWATDQLYLVGGAFSLLAVLAYLKAHPPGGVAEKRWLTGSYGLALASMLSMPGAVSLPAVFLVLDASLLKRKAYREKLPLAAMAGVVVGLAFWAKWYDAMLVEPGRDGAFAKLAQPCYGLWAYLSRTVVPVGIAGFYPRPERGAFFTPFYELIVGLVAVGALGVFVARKRWPWLAAAGLAYLAMVAPHLGLARVGNAIAADRYCYAASTVLAVLGGLGACRLVESRRKPLSPNWIFGLGLLGCLGLVVSSRGHCRTWHDSESLWRHAATEAPWSSDVRLGLASALQEAGRADEAIGEIDRVLQIRPGWARALIAKGAIYASLGRFAEAIACDREALAGSPDDPIARLNLGTALAASGNVDEAEAEYRRAVRRDPDQADVRQKLGSLLLQGGRLDEAVAEFEAALRASPWHAEAHANLGATLAFRGDHAGAIPHFRKAMAVDPANPFARVNLGISLAQLGRLDEAAAELAGAVAADPANVPARFALGAVLAETGHSSEAIAAFRAVLEADPSHDQARAMIARMTGTARR